MFLLGDIVTAQQETGEWEIVFVYAKYKPTDIQRYRLREVTKRGNPIMIDLIPEEELRHV